MNRTFPLSIRAGLIIALAVVAQHIPISSSFARQNPTGIWFNDTGKGAIEIYQCGRSYCGKIIWLKQPISAKTGKPLRDAYNPSPERRKQTICGLIIIRGLRKQTDGSWDGGSIYDPKVGKSYNVAIDLLERNQLRVTGYLGARFLGKSFIWRRAPRDLTTCKPG